LGRIHVGVQDLRKLQTRKMRGLKRRADDDKDEGRKRPKVQDQPQPDSEAWVDDD
jgi:hypothetical protein